MAKDNVVRVDFVEKRAQEEFKKGFEEAEALIKDKDKLEIMLQKLEKKLKVIPRIGGALASVPLMVSCVRSYIKKEYREIPVGTIIAVVSALLYFMSPIDIIPDAIPGLGHVDDAMVIAACLKLVGSDLQEYGEWRRRQEDKANA